MTRLCHLARPWLHPALLDYVPLEQRTQRLGSQEDIRRGLIALGLGIGRAADGASTERAGHGSAETADASHSTEPRA